MTGLNKQQQAAVRLIDRPLLVLAGAGSGKTRVITEKIAWLVKKESIPARHIAALTFTNKAAREMKSRVAQLLDDNNSRGLRVSTFHALGQDILHREHQVLGYKAGISLFDQQDKITLLRNLIAHGVTDGDLEAVEYYSQQISHWKNACLTPAESLSAVVEPEQLISAHLYDEYTRSLKAYNAIDLDDLILLPVYLFQQHPDILEKWQNRIRYLLVDEYQDTNITQYQLVKLLTGHLGRFTVVGDDDQSIYAWRGAQPENLQQLQKDYPRLQVIKLEQNYRSMGRILKAANHLIANNPHTFKKKLWSELGFGEPLRVLAHRNDLAEAKQVVSEIIHHKFRHGARFSDYAILYRGNHQSRLFERCLRENNVPYFITGGTSFFACQEVKDILAYCRLFVNPNDDAAFLRIVNTPRREIGPNTLEKLGDYATSRHISLFSACSEFGVRQKLPDKAIARLQKFCHWISDTAQQIDRGDPFSIIRQVVHDIQYEQWLRENSKTPTAAERRMRNIDDLIDWLQRIAENDAKPLAEVINHIQLMDVLERQQEEEAGDRVSLMTLHAAKGLEFPHVFLIGFEENLLPHQNSIDAGQIAEERRLAYVGITRAQKTCTFSYCTHRKRYGQVEETTPSRFLSELPEEDLEWPQKKKLDPEIAKQRGKQNLAQLKNMLQS